MMYKELNKALKKTVTNKPLLQYGFLQVGVVLLFTILFYWLFLAILQVQLGVPTDIILTYLENEALPESAYTTILIGAAIYGLLLFTIFSFFQAGIFSLRTE